MGESTLSITYLDLKQAVARFLGFGRDPALWTSDQAADIEAVVESGLRQFYNPPPLPQLGNKSHSWSFLHPVTTLSTSAGEGDYTLPDDFGGIEGHLTFEPDKSYEPIIVTGEARIRTWRQLETSTGIPTHAAVRPADSAATGQRFELLLHPTPDAAYTLTYRYAALPGKLENDSDYPLGGMAHAETVLQSCLAVAEQRLEEDGGTRQHELFLQRLAGSIRTDQGANRPEYLGYNGDASGAREGRIRPGRRVLYNGTYYTGS